jgi:hypothetical protein
MKERTMKRVAFLSLLIVLLTTVVLAGSVPAEAQSMPTWNSVIAYFNPNPGPISPPEELSVVLYKDDGTQDFSENSTSTIPMLPFQSGTLLLGTVTIEPDFKGSAMLSSTVPIMAVYKRVASDNEAYSPILYTSFDINQAGQGIIFIPSVRRLADYDTQVGIQNAESLPIDLEITVYDQNGDVAYVDHTDPDLPIPSLTSYIFKMSSFGQQIAVPFEGSLVIRSRLAGTSVSARIVAAVQEIQAGGRRAFAYEGLTGIDHYIFMPTAACLSGETSQSTVFTVQNTGAAPTDIHVDYYDESGELVANSSTVTTAPYASATFDACSAEVLEFTQGKEMSAVVVSDEQKIAVVGKLESSAGLMTAYTGQPMEGHDSSGIFRVVLPYVEWSTRANGFQTTISVMNTSGAPAQNVKAYYYANKGSSPVATHNIGTASNPLMHYARRTTSPVAARAVEGRGFNGAVIIESDRPIVALARVVRTVDINGYQILGEDYNGIPYNP